MHSFRSVFPMQHVSFLVAVAAFTAGTAIAQTTHSSGSPTEETPTMAESSSTSAPFSFDNADGAAEAALPASPSPNGAGTGAAARSQGSYDSHNNGSFFSRMAWEFGGGFNAPLSDGITWGYNFTAGGGLRFNQRLSGLIEYQFIH